LAQMQNCLICACMRARACMCVCDCVCVYVCMYVCVCVCVCVKHTVLGRVEAQRLMYAKIDLQKSPTKKTGKFKKRPTKKTYKRNQRMVKETY